MHWILTIPDTFVLSHVIQQSQQMLHPPFTVKHAKGHLGRVERLTSRRTIALTVSQTSAGLVLQCNERLSDKDTEELSHKTWRMLRLGEDLQPFLELARCTPGLRATLQHGARLLRGTSLFEDVVKAIILSMNDEQWRDQRMTWIVDQFGDPLPSNPTLHAFPTPSQIVRGYELLADVLEPVIAESLVAVAAEFHTESKHIDADTNEYQSLEALTTTLTSHLKLDEPALGLVMLALGRYDYIPTDHRAQERVRKHITDRAINPAALQTMFELWQPWGGLAFWLWDWSATRPDNGEITWKA